MAKSLGQPRQVAIVMDEEYRVDTVRGEVFTSYKAIIGHIVGEAVATIEEVESR